MKTRLKATGSACHVCSNTKKVKTRGKKKKKIQRERERNRETNFSLRLIYNKKVAEFFFSFTALCLNYCVIAEVVRDVLRNVIRRPVRIDPHHHRGVKVHESVQHLMVALQAWNQHLARVVLALL